MLQNPEKEEEEELYIAKDCEVEVCSEEEGFIGAWYKAILEDTPTKSGRKRLRVRYMTLVQEDGSTLLTETVEQRLIRPPPPEDLNDDVVFVEGSVVDADLKDGWWKGVVVKKLEEDKFLVYFDTPPDIIQFNRKQLRPHLDWTDSEWVRPENKELTKSLFSSGTKVEVSRKIDKIETVWVPAIVIKEGDKKDLVVKSCNKSLTFNADEVKPSFTVDLCNVRPIPPPSFIEEYSLLDRVDAFRGFAWRQCLVRGILSDQRYSVSFVATKEESVFKHSDLRPTQEWEDGVWHQRPKGHSEKETLSDGKRKKSETTLSEINKNRPKKLKLISSCVATKPITKHTRKSRIRAEATEGETELNETVDAMESQLAQDFGNLMADDMMNGAATPVITPQVIPIEKDSVPPETSVINATQLREPEAETQGMTTPKNTLQPMKMQNDLGIDSTGEKLKRPIRISLKGKTYKRKREQKHDSNVKETEALIADTSENVFNDDDQPLSAWILGGKSSSGSDKSMLTPDGTPTAVKNSDADETGASEDTTMVLPFVKRSPVWKMLESMEVFKTAKQSPHFIPLLDIREEFREGSAVGEMVKFTNLLERVKSLQLHTPISTLDGLKDCFFELEKYGFDVTAPISRIDMMLSLIDENVNIEDKLKDNEKEKTEEVGKVLKVEEDLKDVEGKILELQSQKADLNENKYASEQKISRMEMCAEDLNKRSQEVELQFQKIASASW